MRLDDFDPNINVEDQRGSGGGGFNLGGGGGGLLLGLLPMVFSRFGCGGVAVLAIVFFVFGGGSQMLGGGAPVGGSNAPTEATAGKGAAASCTVDAASKVACNAFSSADKTWAALFAQGGKQFQQPKLVFFSGNGQSGCAARRNRRWARSIAHRMPASISTPVSSRSSRRNSARRVISRRIM